MDTMKIINDYEAVLTRVNKRIQALKITKVVMLIFAGILLVASVILFINYFIHSDAHSIIFPLLTVLLTILSVGLYFIMMNGIKLYQEEAKIIALTLEEMKESKPKFSEPLKR